MPKEFNIQRQYETTHVKNDHQYSKQLLPDKVNKWNASQEKSINNTTHSQEKHAAAGKASKCQQGVIYTGLIVRKQ